MPALRNCLISSFTLHGAGSLAMAEDGASRLTSLSKLVKRYLYKYVDRYDDIEQKFCLYGKEALRIVPIDNALNRLVPLGLVFHEVLNLVHAQANLSQESIYLAGVLTDGDVLDDPQVVIGPGIAKAQSMTTAWARVPRIVVDPRLLRRLDEEPLLRKDTHTAEQELRFIQKLIKRGHDGLYFVNYLECMETECDDVEEYGNFLKNHRDRLVEQLENSRSQGDRILQLGWIRRYHNDIIRRLFTKRKEKASSRKTPKKLHIGGHTEDELRIPRLGPLVYPF